MNGSSPPAITFREVSCSFDGRAILDNVSFKVAPGEAFCPKRNGKERDLETHYRLNTT